MKPLTIDSLVAFGFWFLFGFVVFMMGTSWGEERQQQIMTDRCKTTGMYLTEGYAISCRVLTNEGYAPMIEQQKGK